MKRVIITGATGFIGQYLVEELLLHDYEVHAIVRNIVKANGIFSNHDHLYLYECDMKDYLSLSKMLNQVGQFDILYHLAWMGVHGSDISNAYKQIDNIKSIVDLMNVMKILHISKFIGVGSIHEFELLNQIEKNDYDFQPNTIYKSAKLAAHYMAQSLAKQYDIEFYWPIITNAYGAREESNRLILTLARSLLKGYSPQLTAGSQIYDFIYVSDVAKALYLISEKGKPNCEYVIGSGIPRPLRDYLIEAQEILNPDIELAFGTAPFTGIQLDDKVYDNQSLCHDTGFKPVVSFSKGIHILKEWLEMRPQNEV